MGVWDRFEALVLERMEARVSELLEQGGVTSPKAIAHVRETAAWAAEQAIARGFKREAGRVTCRRSKTRPHSGLTLSEP
jgi:hypothetical protein